MQVVLQEEPNSCGAILALVKVSRQGALLDNLGEQCMHLSLFRLTDVMSVEKARWLWYEVKLN